MKNSKTYNYLINRRWVLGFALFIMFITTLPYLIGFAKQGQDWVYTGFVLGVEDGNSYIAKMLSGAEGAWLFRTPYTTYLQRGVMIFLPYILLGKLALGSARHEQLILIFHLFRIFAGILAILATHDFMALFVKDTHLRKWGLALATLGGGLGWVLVIIGSGKWLGSLPLEYYSPESFGFLGLYSVGHLALARALLLWGLRAYLVTVIPIQHHKGEARSSRMPLKWWWFSHERSKRNIALRVGILWLLIGLAQPLTGMVVGAVVGIHLLVLALWLHWRTYRRESADWQRWRTYARQALWAGLVASPLVMYNIVAFTTDPYLKIWTEQSRIPAPHFLHYIIAYGLLFPYAIVGYKLLLKRNPWSAWLLVGWTLSLPVLAYAPFSLQRRLIEGIWVGLVAVALSALDGKNIRVSLRQLIPLTLVFPSTFFLLVGGISAVAQPTEPLFLPVGEIEVFRYMEANALPNAVVLAAYETSNALPAWAPVQVLIGHGPESAGIKTLSPRVANFYQSATSDFERLELLDSFNISYVFWGLHEKNLGNWDPREASYLYEVFNAREYSLFAVDTANLP